MVIVIMKSIYTCIVIILLTKRSDIYFIITLIEKLRIKNNDKTLTTNNNKEAIELPVD